MIYDVWQLATSLTWTDAIITVTDPTVNCGPLEFSIENLDGTAIDPLVFTYSPADAFNDHTFTVYTEDDLMEGPHDFVIKAWFTNYNTNVSQKNF